MEPNETTVPATETATPAEQPTPKKGKGAAAAAAATETATPARHKASIGRIVIVKGQNHNGSDEHPAVVTRVWATSEVGGVESEYVNTTMFPDAGQPCPVTSVHLFQTREEAIAYREANPGSPAAFWPPRA